MATIGEILRKKIIKSRKKKKESMIKKHRPVQVRSRSMDNYGILLEIIPRLPLKSFIRFKCVSKHWKSLISSHHFRELHHQRHTARSVLTVMQATKQQKKKYRMLMEILSWLPVKSLLRFMCVCRNWKTLITSLRFSRLHRMTHLSSHPVLIASYRPCRLGYRGDYYTNLVKFDQDGKILEEFTLPLPPYDFHMVRLPNAAKLLCFVSYLAEVVYLYNPTTRQTFELTNPSCFSSPGFRSHYNTIYGYSRSKDEYIIVHLVKSNNKVYCEFLEISISDNFKLHYNEWRSVEAPETVINNYTELRKPWSCIYADGYFYWERKSCELLGDSILSFCVSTKEFSSFCYPELYRGKQDTLLEFNGWLYLARFPQDFASLQLWKLHQDKDDAVWIEYWNIDFERFFGFENGPFKPVSNYFRWDVFIYNLKYRFKNYVQQCDPQMSAEMRDLLLKDPIWFGAADHTNLLSL